jgi:DNA polymerase III subunit epsilon
LGNDRGVIPPLTLAETAFAAIDFESAGARRGGTDVPVQIGIACLDRLSDTLGDSFVSYLASDRPIIWSAQKVHGISTEHLAGAPALLTLWPRLNLLLQSRWIVAHGAATEKRFLRAFPFHGFGPWVDTLKLSRAVWPDLPSYALGDLIVTLELESDLRALLPDFRWHDALSDSVASLILLKHVIKTTALAAEHPDILLRADDSFYHRQKAAARSRVFP